MKTFRVVMLSLLGGAGLSNAASFAAVAVDEKVVGPVLEPDSSRPFNPYTVSPRGGRLATVVRKGSRVSVTVDGVEGPRFDAIIPPTLGYIDPRTPQALQNILSTLQPLGPGYTQSGFGGLGPVVYSRDGKRFAYLARQAQEWVLIADGKEVVRQPAEGIVSAVTLGGPSGTVDVRIEFAGEDGKHLMFAKSVYGGYELWVDGKKMPGIFQSGGGGSEGTLDPVISRDGARFAYVAQMDRDKRALVLDGKVANYFGTDLQFSADGKVFYCIASDDKTHEKILLVDGKPGIRGTSIRLFIAPVGNRTIALVTQAAPEGGQKYFLVVDGRKVETAEVAGFNTGIDRVTFSPDGKRYAAIVKASQNVTHVIVDGKKGQRYDDIPANTSLAFSPDSGKFGYVAQSAGKFFVVINEEESDAFDPIPSFGFSPNGKRVAYTGMKSGGLKLYVDGKPVGQASNIVFSPDSSRYAFTTSPHKEIHVDGKNTGLRGEKFMFSPDSKHFAAFGAQSSVDPKSGVLAQFASALRQGMFLDGQHLWGTFEMQNLRYQAFTPDSKHLFWMTEEPAIGSKAGPGKFECVTYLDGQSVARFDRESQTISYIYTAANYQFMGTRPAWDVDAEGALSFLGPVDDVVKRFTIKPAAGIGIAAMIAEAEAAPARAAAAEAEAKKKSDEAVAAKKAKREADLAEAAAKAKADYDARVAKQKSDAADAAAKAKVDYDARVAKQKADYDARVAKQKADYDAAVAKQKADREAALAKQAELLKQKQQKK